MPWSRIDLPDVAPLGMAASALEVKSWLAVFGHLEARATADHARILELERQAAERHSAIAPAKPVERMLSVVTRSSRRVTGSLRRIKRAVRPLWRRREGRRR